MKRLLSFLILLHTYLTAEPIAPVDRAPKPGRLVGWGDVGTGLPVSETLPQGAEAEGFIQVETSAFAWIAVREDGSALMGGSVDWAQRPLPNFEKRIVQAAIATHWIVLLEDGTVHCGGSDGNQRRLDALNVPSHVKDIVNIAAGGERSLALDRSGRLSFWGYRKTWGDAFQAKLETHGRSVDMLASGRFGTIFRESNGRVWRLHSPAGKGDLQEQGAFSKADLVQLVAGTGATYGLTSDGRILSSTSARYPVEERFVRLAAGEHHLLGQQEDGTWISFEANYQGEADPKRLTGLLAFSINGRKEKNRGFGIGIAPSALEVPALDRPLAEAAVILEKLRLSEEEADRAVAAWKARYFQALDDQARKESSPDLKQLVAQEKRQAEILSRPPISHPALSRLQKVFRERLPSLVDARTEGELAALKEATTQLQQLQDSLTLQKRLEDAVTARTLRLALAQKREVLAGLAGASSSVASPQFPPIASSERRFAVDDPIEPGELVVIGTVSGSPLELQPSVNRRRVQSAHAAGGFWILMDHSGNFDCRGANGSLSRLNYGYARSLGKLEWVHTTHAGLGYFGQDRRGKFVAWGWDKNLEEPPNYPDFLKGKDSFLDVKVRTTGGPGKATEIQRLLALKRDGTVLAGGILYKTGRPPWQLPANLGLCRALFQNPDVDGALRRDGTLILWGGKGMEVPGTFSGLVQIRHWNQLVLGLHQDGTVLTWNTGNLSSQWVPLVSVPPGLDEVIDLEFRHGLALALRADGTWVGWGTNPDGILEEIPKLKGCRRVTIAGTTQERLIFGIRAEQ